MPVPKKVIHLTSTGWAMLYAPILNLAASLKSEGFENTIVRPQGQFAVAKIVESTLSQALFASTIELRGCVKFQRLINAIYRAARLSDNARAGVNFFLEVGLESAGGFYIGYDAPGAAMAWSATRINRKPYAIFSLEIEENPEVGFYEKRAWSNAQAIITFDRNWAQIISSQYNIPLSKFVLIPNSSIGECYSRKSNFLRHRLSIPDSKVIILMTGSLIDLHCVRDVILSAISLPENCVLVLHGWCLSDENKKLYDRVKAQKSEQIFLSTEILPHDEKFEVFASADIGIVSFSSDSLSTNRAGASAGKLFDFCQAGVPVIASNHLGLRELVQDNGVGYVVDDFQTCFKNIGQLLADRDGFKSRCHQFFTENEFGRKSKEALKSLELI